jgi:hypothetical protein
MKPSPIIPRILLAALLLAPISIPSIQAQNNSPQGDHSPLGELDQRKINQIAGYLTAQPDGIGLSKPISDRSYWNDPKQVGELEPFIRQAEKRLGETFPAWNDDDYLDFNRTGQRPRGEKMQNERHGWLPALVYAECIENKGRFLPLINKLLQEYANEPTWTMPAHDGKLTSYHGSDYFLDLGASIFGLRIAQTLYLLGDKVDPKIREQLLKELEQRVFDPLRRTLATGRPCGWLGGEGKEENNWNPVCLSGAVGSALCVLPDKKDRALFISIGEHYSKYYLASFTADGYCTEGGGYWNFGFGHYALLREEILHATGGRIDLFSDPSVIPSVLYAQRFRIGASVVPPFADCRFGAKIDSHLLSYCNEALGLGLNLPPTSNRFEFAHSLIAITPTHLDRVASSPQTKEDPLRFYFDKVGALSCRSAMDGGLGVGIKAGGNFSHSHNDVGSYEIALNDEMPTGDPGGPMRYEKGYPHVHPYKIQDSYGHPLPVIGGQLQLDATKTHPAVLSTSFTDEHDQIVIDMKSAYGVPSLKNLTRTMDYDRKGEGAITITDEAAFSTPTTFEDALITHGTWKQIAPDTIELSMRKAKLIAKINASAPFTIKPETITELGVTFTRLGIVYNQPSPSAKLVMTFTSSR